MLQLLGEKKFWFGPRCFLKPSFHHIPSQTDAVQGQNTKKPMSCFPGNVKPGKSLRCFISPQCY